ncbi:MAG: hypothetical protein M3P43_07610 [Actinomycetota bacterium]|nr:hypothetical protein [Actinomycetota bacterium]
MNVWSAVVGGLAGTLVLTTILRGATELRLTRIDLPFLLGTAVTSSRELAKVIGYAAHFAFGALFALGYYLLFLTLGASGPLLGAVFGLAHGLFAGTALVNVLLPIVHPRMGSDISSSRTAPLLEAPGFMMLNYGAATPLVSLFAHASYGAIVGTFVLYGSR